MHPVEPVPDNTISDLLKIRLVQVYCGVAILLFVPMLTLVAGLLILVTSPFLVGWRLLTCKTKRIHPLFLGYLSLAIILGVAFACLPSLILKCGWEWWIDSAQEWTFIVLFMWLVASTISSFLAPRRYCLVSLFSVITTTGAIMLLMLYAEAGDLLTLSKDQFPVMRIAGTAQYLAPLIGLMFLLAGACREKLQLLSKRPK